MSYLKFLDALTEALGTSEGQSTEEIKEELRNDGMDVDGILTRLKASQREISMAAKYPEHNTDSDVCWCDPDVVEYSDGSKLIIHNQFN